MNIEPINTPALETYSTQAARQAGQENAKYLIYSVNRHGIHSSRDFVGGLADRLKGIYSAFLMAIATERVFLIDWEVPFPLSDNLAPNRYDWRLAPHLKKLGTRPEIVHLDMIDKRGNRLKETPPDVLEQEIFQNHPTCVININWLYDRAFAKKSLVPGRHDAAFEKVFDFLFEPQTAKSYRTERTQIEKRRQSHDGLFGVHLRTGGEREWQDGRLDKRRSYRPLMKAAFEFAADQGSQNPLFYFASDSEKSKRAVAKRTWPHEVISLAGPIEHLDRTVEMTRQGNDFSFFEFDLLGRCDGIIGGVGAYYQIAAMAGGKPYRTYTD